MENNPERPPSNSEEDADLCGIDDDELLIGGRAGAGRRKGASRTEPSGLVKHHAKQGIRVAQFTDGPLSCLRLRSRVGIARFGQDLRRHPSEIELVPKALLDFVDGQRSDAAGLHARDPLGDDRTALAHGVLSAGEASDGLDQLRELVGQQFGGLLHEVLNSRAEFGGHSKIIALSQWRNQAA